MKFVRKRYSCFDIDPLRKWGEGRCFGASIQKKSNAMMGIVMILKMVEIKTP